MSILLRRVYSEPIPLRIQFSKCLNSCSYCSFQYNSHEMTTLKQIENAVMREKEDGLLSHFIINRYPISFNTDSDFFALEKKDMEIMKRSAELLHDAGFPLMYETKGFHNQKDLEWFLNTVSKKDILYVTITSFDENKKKLLEKAPSIQTRLELIEMTKSKVGKIIIGFNPVISDFISEKEILDFVKKHEKDNFLYFIQDLHPIKTRTKEISELLQKPKLNLDKLFDYMRDKKIPVNSHKASISNYTASEEMRLFFNKPQIISADVNNSLLYVYNEISKEMTEEEIKNTAIGGLSFEKFYEINKDNFIDCAVKRSEIYFGRQFNNYVLNNIPDKISYKDFIKIMYQNQNIDSIITYSNFLFTLSNEKGKIITLKDGSPCYAITEQPYFNNKRGIR